MNGLRVIIAVAALLAFVDTPRTQRTPAVHYLQLPDGIGCIRRVVGSQDLNADGKLDVVTSIGACVGESDDVPARLLRVHLRRPGRPLFQSAPDRELRLVRDVVAFAVGDVHPNPGAEIVLFSPRRVVAVFWPDGAKGEPRYAALCTSRFLWQPANSRVAFDWQQGVTDIDGDGFVDLLIPEHDGYRVAFQRRRNGADAAFESVTLLRLPPQPVTDRERGTARFEAQRESLVLAFGDRGDRDRKSDQLLELEDRIPAPRLADWDGDGDLDVCALSGEELSVFSQDPRGTFTSDPSERHELPERRGSLLNPSFSVQLHDVNGDRRADVVMVSSKTQDDEIRSTVEVFVQPSDGAPSFERATDRLRLRGFVGIPSLDDVDGDGRPDLAIGSLRTDLIDTLSSGGSGDVEAQINLFRNAFTGGDSNRFARPAAMVHRVTLKGLDLQSRDRALARFVTDVDGDGLADLLMRRGPEEIVVLPTRKSGRRFALGEPLWTLEVDEDAPAELVGTGGAVELLVREPRQLVLVVFP